MENAELVAEQRNYFNSKETLPYDFRISQLKKILDLTIKFEDQLLEALFKDLHKSKFEAWGVEVGLIQTELKYFIGHLKKWMKPKRLSTPLFHIRAKSYIQKVPYGNTLIIAPWNYPFLLAIRPLIGAIAAGNTAIIKPSENAPFTAAVLEEMINKNFDKNYLHVINTNAEGTQDLLKQKFDFIFFTGGTNIGRHVYEAAAKHLTPVALELGGKNPCIIDDTADLDITAARITMGAFSNCGQTCVTPDYILVPEGLKEQLLEKIINKIEISYGKDIKQSPDFGRIINTSHFDRITNLLKGQNIIYGGITDREEKYISPTIIMDPDPNSPLMREEIFGPVLPIIGYTDLTKALELIKNNPDPLVLYLFTKNNYLINKIAEEIRCGDMVINEVMLHFGHFKLPIGGVGNSGIGKYQGKYSFDEFSHKKSVMRKYFFPELNVRYPPYDKGKMKFLKSMFKWFMWR